MKTILSNAHLIDCVRPAVRPDTAVRIEDGRIRAILPSGEAGSVSEAQAIDLKCGYLMPGLEPALTLQWEASIASSVFPDPSEAGKHSGLRHPVPT